MEKKVVRKKFGCIDSLKGILCLLIFFEHFGLFGLDVNTGYLVVEVFFIISGFLLANSLAKYKSIDDVNAFKYTFAKAKKIYPLYLLGILLMFFYRLLFKQALPSILSIASELFMVQKLGLVNCDLLNGADWYVSAYLIATLLIVLFLKAFKNKNIRILVGMFSILWYLNYMFRFGNLDIPYIMGFIDNQMFKAIVCMSLGIFTYHIIKELDVLKKPVQSILFILSMFLFFECIFNRSIHHANSIILLAGVGMLVSSNIDKGIIYSILNIWPIKSIGKLSTAVYLMHLFAGGMFQHYITFINNVLVYNISLIIFVIFFAAIANFITNFIAKSKIYNNLKTIINSVIFDDKSILY